jgi:hypothetical protein
LPQKTLPWPRWAILTLLVASPSIHPVVVALTSRNAGSVRTRTIASALYNMSVQISNIAGSNVSLLAWHFLLSKRRRGKTHTISRSIKQRMHRTTDTGIKFWSHFLLLVWLYLWRQSSTTTGGIGKFPHDPRFKLMINPLTCM